MLSLSYSVMPVQVEADTAPMGLKGRVGEVTQPIESVSQTQVQHSTKYVC